MPEVFSEDTPLNYVIVEHMEDFKVAQFQKKAHPTADEVEANKRKCGWSG